MSIWQNIPLKDYEEHMSHKSVGQLSLLSTILKEKLMAYKPDSLRIWGVAGGNGLENIDSTIISEVVGIDINEEYLNTCNNRFAEKISNLCLYNFDLIQENNGISSVSETNIESIQNIKSVFEAINKDEVKEKATKYGFFYLRRKNII